MGMNNSGSAGDLVAGVLPRPDNPTGDKIAGATPKTPWTLMPRTRARVASGYNRAVCFGSADFFGSLSNVSLQLFEQK